MNRIPVAAAIILTGSLLFTAGCTTKKTVARETAPLINKTNELDDLTAKTTRDIKDLDARTTQGLNDVNAKSAAADQKAQAAQQQADQANEAAKKASTGVDALTNTVANLDNYHAVVETTVHFGFDKADLSKKAKDALDKLAAEIPNTKGYIIAGNTDSTGPADYNYQLSQRRARAVIQYLATEHQVPAHKIYLIGLGKDKPVAENKTSKGRAENRRVDVKLMTNVVGSQQAQTPNQAPTTAQQ